MITLGSAQGKCDYFLKFLNKNHTHWVKGALDPPAYVPQDWVKEVPNKYCPAHAPQDYIHIMVPHKHQPGHAPQSHNYIMVPYKQPGHAPQSHITSS